MKRTRGSPAGEQGELPGSKRERAESAEAHIPLAPRSAFDFFLIAHPPDHDDATQASAAEAWARLANDAAATAPFAALALMDTERHRCEKAALEHLLEGLRSREAIFGPPMHPSPPATVPAASPLRAVPYAWDDIRFDDPALAGVDETVLRRVRQTWLDGAAAQRVGLERLVQAERERLVTREQLEALHAQRLQQLVYAEQIQRHFSQQQQAYAHALFIHRQLLQRAVTMGTVLPLMPPLPPSLPPPPPLVPLARAVETGQTDAAREATIRHTEQEQVRGYLHDHYRETRNAQSWHAQRLRHLEMCSDLLRATMRAGPMAIRAVEVKSWAAGRAAAEEEEEEEDEDEASRKKKRRKRRMQEAEEEAERKRKEKEEAEAKLQKQLEEEAPPGETEEERRKRRRRLKRREQQRKRRAAAAARAKAAQAKPPPPPPPPPPRVYDPFAVMASMQAAQVAAPLAPRHVQHFAQFDAASAASTPAFWPVAEPREGLEQPQQQQQPPPPPQPRAPAAPALVIARPKPQRPAPSVRQQD